VSDGLRITKRLTCAVVALLPHFGLGPGSDGPGLLRVIHAQVIDRPSSPEKQSSNKTSSTREQAEKRTANDAAIHSSIADPPHQSQTAGRQSLPVAQPESGACEAIELPKRDDTKAFEIARATGALDIRLLNPDGNPCRFQASRDDRPGAWTISDNENAVATITHRGDSLVFSWLPHAPAAAESLRNTVLTFQDAATIRHIALRTVATGEPVGVDLGRPATSIALDFELWGFDPNQLRLEIVQVVSNPAPKRYIPESRQCAAGEIVRVMFRDRAPCAELQLRIATAGGRTSLSISPLLTDRQSQLLWTIGQTNSMRLGVSADMENAKAAIAQLQQDMEEAKSDIRTLGGSANKGGAGAQAAQKSIASLQSRIAADQANITTMQHSLQAWSPQLSLLEELGSLATAIHRRATIAVRVFFIVDVYEVDIFRAG
jgi:hypothetical protein